MMVAFGSDEIMKIVCGQRSFINYLEKSNLVGVCFGSPGYSGRQGGSRLLRSTLRVHLMSYLQRHVSMFVYIFPYAVYEDMRGLSACPGLPMR